MRLFSLSLKLFVEVIMLWVTPIITLNASSVTEVFPLTDQILVVHFNDGDVVYHKNGDIRDKNADKINQEVLDVAKATNPSSYWIVSTTDEQYRQGKNPVQVGRKSKGSKFAFVSLFDGLDFSMQNKAVCEHWCYLFLPYKMVEGETYKLSFNSLAKSDNIFSFVFEEKSLRSEAIHVNQIGYIPTANQKMGYVYHWMGDKGSLKLSDYAGNKFYIIDYDTKKEIFSGKLTFRKAADNMETGWVNDTPNNNFLGAEVYECDFSSFQTPGKYYLVVKGIGRSFPFTIGEDIYRKPYQTTMRGLFHNRSGIELTKEFTDYVRPAPHNVNITPGFARHLRYSSVRACDTQSDGGDALKIKTLIESGDKGEINTWGWYQDAGDWDGYPSHMRIPAYLLLAYELSPSNYVDGELNIPQSISSKGELKSGKKNGLPDILDEAIWLIQYFYRTRHAVMKAGYGTGGIAGARVMGDYWGPDLAYNKGAGSWQDIHRTWYVMGEDPMSSYWYAGLTAQYAYLLKIMNQSCPTGIDWEQEAIESYKWAEANNRKGDEHALFATIKLKDARMYGAVSLYRLTGKNEYHSQFIDDSREISKQTVLGEDTRIGVALYTLLPPKERPSLSYYVEQFKGAISQTALVNVLNASENRACRWGGDYYMPMLIGQATTPWIFDAILDYVINKNEKARTVALTTLDYFMGVNPLNLIWFTGEKEDINNKERRHVKGIFHLDSWYNVQKEDCEVPGFSPYGPWHQEEDWTKAQGWWRNEWAYSTAYPAMQHAPFPKENRPDAWPGHELWFSQRYAPMACENTIHQNTVHWGIATGFFAKGITDNPFTYYKKLAVAEPYKPLPKPQTVIVNPNQKHQIIEGWGSSLCWWAAQVGQWEPSRMDSIIRLFVSPDGANMNIFRYNIGGGDNPEHIGGHMLKGKGKRAEMEGFKASLAEDYNFEADKGQRAVMLRIKELRPDAVFEAFSNSPPYWMTYSGCSSGNINPQDNNLKPEFYELFCDYLIDVCKYYKDKYGIEFRTLEPFNESISCYWMANGSQEGCHFSEDAQIRIIEILYSKLQKAGLKTVISASDETDLSSFIRVMNYYKATNTVFSKLGQINTHTYSGTNKERIEAASLIQQIGLPFWQSETGPSGGRGLKSNLDLARKMFDDMRYLKPKAWLDWQLMEEHNGEWCLLQSDFNTKEYQIMKNYYVRMQITRFFKQGYRIIDSNCEQIIAAMSPEDNEIVISVLNNFDVSQLFNIEINETSDCFYIKEVYRTSENEECKKMWGKEISVTKDGKFEYVAPENSITTFICRTKCNKNNNEIFY